MTRVTLNKKNNDGLTPLFNEVFNDFFGGSNLPRFYGKSIPVNTYETEKSYHLEFSAPGFEKTDFRIHLEKYLLAVSAEKKQDENYEEKKYSKREYNLQSFERTFNLPDNVDEDKIIAEYKNGILTIELPKKNQEKNNLKQITIK